jgi:hypothetical protein
MFIVFRSSFLRVISREASETAAFDSKHSGQAVVPAGSECTQSAPPMRLAKASPQRQFELNIRDIGWLTFGLNVVGGRSAGARS